MKSTTRHSAAKSASPTTHRIAWYRDALVGETTIKIESMTGASIIRRGHLPDGTHRENVPLTDTYSPLNPQPMAYVRNAAGELADLDAHEGSVTKSKTIPGSGESEEEAPAEEAPPEV